MTQAAATAEKVATYRHPKLSAVRLAGEVIKKPTGRNIRCGGHVARAELKINLSRPQ